MPRFIPSSPRYAPQAQAATIRWIVLPFGLTPSFSSPIQTSKHIFSDRSSPMTASMLRDLERGGPTEGAHIVGDMLARARAAGIDPGPLRAAWCHLQTAEHRRLREARSAPAR